ncbi:helix-turn-helix domain-containing protein [Microbispora sp. H10949]|uniref:helix-turn-helix domain-containing protein n=1 Tax=Microbispora sp. H10949 TaxID=2729111 RepID=UPI001602F2E8|nr:helix-turn-helix transcriptional regulator [Microbispora sp. H10949]
MGDWPAVAKVINERMLALGLTQKRLAELSRVSTATLRQVQQGQDKNRQPAVLTAISRALGLPDSYLQEVADKGRAPAVMSDESAAVAELRDQLADLRERVAAIETRLELIRSD